MEKAKVAVYYGKKAITGEKVVFALKKVKIPFSMITAEDIGGGRLDEFKAVIFPGGHSIVLNSKEKRNFFDFIRNGGGVVGICAGAQFGYLNRLLPVEHKIFRATGIFDMRIVKKHPITKGYVVAPKSKNRRNWRYSPKGRVRIRYENGGLFSVKGKVDMLVSFDEKNMFGAVVAGKYGKGKVVLIAPHPESTPPGKVLRWSQKRGYYESRLQEPLKLFGNAVRYVLK